MIFYICGVDWQHDPISQIRFYPTIEELKEKRTCWSECGIVKVLVSNEGVVFREWVEPQQFGNKK